MSGDKEMLQRLRGALTTCGARLAPFVEARMGARHGAQWAFASRAAHDPRGA
jgi:hypothetical protein